VRERHPRGPLILMYHGVVERYQDPLLEEYCIDKATLERQLRFVRKKYLPVPLSVLIDALKSGRRLDERWVAVTLDDSLKNQVTLGASVLSDHRIPWSLSVPAGLIGSSRAIWTNELSFLVLRCWSKESIMGPDGTAMFSTRTWKDKRRTLSTLKSLLLSKPHPGTTQQYLDARIKEVGEDSFFERFDRYGRFVQATWQDLRELSSQGIELISHGWRHLPQGMIPSTKELTLDIQTSRDKIELETGVRPGGFALPNGLLRTGMRSAIEKAEYTFCLTSRPGRATQDTDLLALPRVSGEYSLSLFRYVLSTT
jgi:peptidoglycan/xylan/chitin deacetylase (PgdA/CDA1 family)